MKPPCNRRRTQAGSVMGLAFGRAIWMRKKFLRAKQVHDGRSVHASGAAEKLRAFQDANVRVSVKPVAVGWCADRLDQAEIFPGVAELRAKRPRFARRH